MILTRWTASYFLSTSKLVQNFVDIVPEHFEAQGNKIADINILMLGQNSCHFAGDIFKFILLYENWCCLIQSSLRTQGFNQQETGICSVNCLDPSRWQAILKTNDGLEVWCIYVWPCFDELINWVVWHVLKHQAISIHNADYPFIVLDQFHIKDIAHMVYNIRK